MPFKRFRFILEKNFRHENKESPSNDKQGFHIFMEKCDWLNPNGAPAWRLPGVFPFLIGRSSRFSLDAVRSRAPDTRLLPKLDYDPNEPVVLGNVRR